MLRVSTGALRSPCQQLPPRFTELLRDQAPGVSFVLFADKLDQVRIRDQFRM
jgi:hypothetical protein